MRVKRKMVGLNGNGDRVMGNVDGDGHARRLTTNVPMPRGQGKIERVNAEHRHFSLNSVGHRLPPQCLHV